jgi:hypothetical protein
MINGEKKLPILPTLPKVSIWNYQSDEWFDGVIEDVSVPFAPKEDYVKGKKRQPGLTAAFFRRRSECY